MIGRRSHSWYEVLIGMERRDWPPILPKFKDYFYLNIQRGYLSSANDNYHQFTMTKCKKNALWLPLSVMRADLVGLISNT